MAQMVSKAPIGTLIACHLKKRYVKCQEHAGQRTMRKCKAVTHTHCRSTQAAGAALLLPGLPEEANIAATCHASMGVYGLLGTAICCPTPRPPSQSVQYWDRSRQVGHHAVCSVRWPASAPGLGGSTISGSSSSSESSRLSSNSLTDEIERCCCCSATKPARPLFRLRLHEASSDQHFQYTILAADGY